VKPSGAIKGLALLDGDVIVYVQTLHCMQWPVPAAEGTVWELHALATTGLGAAWAIPIEFAWSIGPTNSPEARTQGLVVWPHGRGRLIYVSDWAPDARTASLIGTRTRRRDSSTTRVKIARSHGP
jgi:hypothetical protein